MTQPILVPEKSQGVNGLWHSAVKAGEDRAQVTLSPLLEDHLAVTLKSHIRNQDISAPIVFSLIEATDSGDPTTLILMGGRCLIIAGLFPKLCQRRTVRIGYYVEMGRNAYRAHADYWDGHGVRTHAHVSYEVAKNFVPLVETLRGMRDSGIINDDLQAISLAESAWN